MKQPCGALRRGLLAIFVFWISHATHAEAQVFRGPESAALGGTGVAGLQGSEAALLNPALIPLFEGSGFDAFFRDGDQDVGQHRQAIGLGAIDNSRDVWFPGTLHYLRLRDTGRSPQPANGELWQLGFGEKAGDHFALGISGSWLVYDLKGIGRITQFNYSVGGIYMVNSSLGVAYVLRNLALPGSEVPAGLREDLQQVVGVFAAVTDLARLRLDILRQERLNPEHKMAYMFGFESKTSPFFVLRLGYRYDDLTGQRFWTAGVGFDGPRLKANYSFEKNQDRVSGAMHSVDLVLPF